MPSASPLASPPRQQQQQQQQRRRRLRRHHGGGGDSSNGGGGSALTRYTTASTTMPHTTPRRRSISFDIRRNAVRMVRAPPRVLNERYWFTETSRIVRKGFSFVIEPHISVDVRVELRMQLTALVHSVHRAAPSSSSLASKPQRGRVHVEVCSPFTLLTTTSAAASSSSMSDAWLCVGSVHVGSMTPLRVVLPAGVYFLRVTGPHAVHVFAQAWEQERRLK